jgi:hypothetical protein
MRTIRTPVLPALLWELGFASLLGMVLFQFDLYEQEKMCEMLHCEHGFVQFTAHQSHSMQQQEPMSDVHGYVIYQEMVNLYAPAPLDTAFVQVVPQAVAVSGMEQHPAAVLPCPVALETQTGVVLFSHHADQEKNCNQHCPVVTTLYLPAEVAAWQEETFASAALKGVRFRDIGAFILNSQTFASADLKGVRFTVIGAFNLNSH